MAADVLTAKELAYARGRRLFKDGKPQPCYPSDEDADKMTVEFCIWLGWMAARATAFFERRRVMEILGVEDTE